MKKWTSKLGTATLAAALAICGSAISAAPAAADASDRASCTGQNISNNAQQDGAFGQRVKAGVQFTRSQGTNLGQGIVSDEARSDRAACP